MPTTESSQSPARPTRRLPTTYFPSHAMQAGTEYDFPDKVTVHFINGVPEGISMNPAEIGADISELEEGSDAELQTSQVVTEGRTYRDPELRNQECEVRKAPLWIMSRTPLFAISEDRRSVFREGRSVRARHIHPRPQAQHTFIQRGKQHRGFSPMH